MINKSLNYCFVAAIYLLLATVGAQAQVDAVVTNEIYQGVQMKQDIPEVRIVPLENSTESNSGILKTAKTPLPLYDANGNLLPAFMLPKELATQETEQPK
jgi:hypothetical protein